ncbi:MAG: tetratricopeptide repeat protein [Acaryochloris sp. RU_4_1]|nr:tetratricopeptide repeat protein [Acaryochloris sp. RU_4_1]NJR56336.1 tetratricopeptide repeat protein [Acaryochloris sp. CRU_2_0]
MKQIKASLIRLLIAGLIVLIGSSATFAEPTSAPFLSPSEQQVLPQQHHGHPFDPKEFLYWFKQCEQLQGQDALVSCEQALKINPHVAAVWVNHGQKLSNFGQYAKALISFENALLLKPDYSLGLANRCGILSVLGQYAQALDSCEMALLGDQQWGLSGQILAWNNRGDALVKMGRYEEALASFHKSLALDPDDIAAQQYCQVVLDKLHKKAPAQPRFPNFNPTQKDQRIALVGRQHRLEGCLQSTKPISTLF